MSKNTPTADAEADKELPQGTTPAFARMHKWLKRFIIICLFGLVIEGAFTVPVLAVWYGAPTLSLTEICDEFMKVRWSDETAECEYPHPIGGPPFGGPGEGTGRDTAKTEWGVQPKSNLDRIRFRELVRNKEEREAREKSQAQAKKQADASPDGTEPEAANTPGTGNEPEAQPTTPAPQPTTPQPTTPQPATP